MEKPIVYPVRFKHGLRCSYASLSPGMNDEDTVAFGTVGERGSFVAVFDGHGGKQASSFCSKHIGRILYENMIHVNTGEKSGKVDCQEHSIAETQLKKSCAQLEKEFRQKYPTNKSGSTLSIVLQLENTIYVAWLGDGEVFSFSNNGSEKITSPHNFNMESERHRIVDLCKEIKEPYSYTLLDTPKDFNIDSNSYQIWFSNQKLCACPPKELLSKFPGAPNASISISKSIGDGKFGPILESIPDVVSVDIGNSNSIFIVGSDGFWDVVSVDMISAVFDRYSICQSIDSFLWETHCDYIKKDLHGIAEDLLETCRLNWGSGSRDDISLFICWVQPAHEIKK